jgi:hypothetical protein
LKLCTEFPGDFPFDIPFPDIRPFVIGFLPFAESKFHLYPAFFEVKGEGDEGISLFVYLPGYSFNFIPVEEEPFFPVRIMVKNRRKGIFGYPQGTNPYFAIDHLRPGVRKGYFAIPEGLDFRPQQFYAAFVTVIHRVIMPGPAV